MKAVFSLINDDALWAVNHLRVHLDSTVCCIRTGKGIEAEMREGERSKGQPRWEATGCMPLTEAIRRETSPSSLYSLSFTVCYCSPACDLSFTLC